MPMDFAYRPATAADALSLSALAAQVFLDTYATNGVTAALAREAGTAYAPQVFEARLRDPTVELLVATVGDRMMSFIDIAFATSCPVPGVQGAEVFRLYVQRPFLRRGLGRALIAMAEASARARGLNAVWLTAWVGNDRALAFYEALGYRDIGVTEYLIEGVAHENRVLCKRIAASAA